MKKISLMLAILIAGVETFAAVKLPQVFTDNMVLQRDAPIPIWGWASPREKIAVRFHDQVKATRADAGGKWRITLDPEKAGGPYELTVQDRKLTNVLVGEVWICSGQSNMEFALRNAMNAPAEVANANYPEIRELTVAKRVSFTPRDDIESNGWQVCSPATAGSFSAVAYFFARKLQQELKVPIGLIHTSWGGTNIETWTSREALTTLDDFKDLESSKPGNIAGENNARLQALRDLLLQFEHGNITANDVPQWKRAAYDDRHWATLKAPAAWETQGLPGFDGVVWYRKTITLTAEQVGKPARLDAGIVDDGDSTFINGLPVGSMLGAYATPRKYNIPAGVLKAGENVIAIKVTDTGGAGGIIGEDNDLQLLIEGLSPITLVGDWKARVDTNYLMVPSRGPNAYPSLLFNAMLNPLIPYAIRGAIWYQGEANCDRAYQYRTTFPLMIKDWRQRWQEGDFPFYFVQLSSFNPGGRTLLTGSAWAELREAQYMTLALPNTGMAVTTDIGNPSDVHPANKQDVGLRLAMNALHTTYKLPVAPCGPLYKDMEVKGSDIVLHFTETAGGLQVRNRYGYLQGFQVAGADQQFHWAQARIENNNVVVHCDAVQTPLAVRYGWTDDAMDANLYNSEGLPASPFRTDNWKGLTEEKKYLVIK
ncbi:sialate O-acetylesterase [Chitinophaga parva]|uniref:Sialate O-acetylesterase n=1 Tax=Chitinophaga parva TaxID=2169414 RepID=A0A2T7BGJ3_9BACT|nr:sialate O-acetylesterase [Chitinophaga parva]PUZ25409.1 sialate O-acetylesterase [Chitinophaga parva]